MDSRTVLVTGATGFLALHVVDQLLAKGYTVIGTARSEKKYQPLLKAFKEKYPDGKLTYAIVKDIIPDDAFDEVLQENPEITAVLHTASPFSFGLDKPNKEAYLIPAVNGTTNILKSIKSFAPQVANVVVTSSFAAILQIPPNHLTTVHKSSTWNPLEWGNLTEEDSMLAYVSSKIEAEKAARKFVTDEQVNFKLTTLNPPFVFGPQLFDFNVTETLNTSNQLLQSVFQLDKSLTEPLKQEANLGVDVRDVAKFHVLPLEIEELSEAREFITSGPFASQQIANVLLKTYPELKGKIPTGDPESVDEVLKTCCPPYDISDIVKAAGGYDFIPVEQSIVDVYKQYFRVFPIGDLSKLSLKDE